MSGGHWDYEGFKIEEIMSRIALDEKVLERWPKIAKLFGALGPLLREAEHDMDWDLSYDSPIKDDAAFEKNIIARAREALDVAGPVYPIAKHVCCWEIGGSHKEHERCCNGPCLRVSHR